MFAICEVLPLSNTQYIALLVCRPANLGRIKMQFCILQLKLKPSIEGSLSLLEKADRAHVHVLPRFELDLTFCKFADLSSLIFCQLYSVLSSDDTILPRPAPPWIVFKHVVQRRPRVALKMWRNRDEKERNGIPSGNQREAEVGIRNASESLGLKGMTQGLRTDR
jgi:hypothetical protein